MMDVGRHSGIKLFSNSEVVKVEGEEGNFKVSILNKARYVDIDTCTGCGDCEKVCPVVKPNDFEVGLGVRKAIYRPFPQAVPSAYIRDADDCLGSLPLACTKCQEACEPGSINYDDKDKIIDVNAGSIIVATGIDYYDPREASEYGYTRFENVVTSFELERILSAGGPTRGALIRITDDKPPKRVAFIQCVGSRNKKRDIDYCSRICCMNAIKDSLIVRELFPDAEIIVFYIDIRAFGKGFEEFYNRSVEEGVQYIRSKPSKIVEDPKTGDLILSYEDTETAEVKEITVDLAVLSSALVPHEGTRKLAEVLGIDVDTDGFFTMMDSCSRPMESTRGGVFLCGCNTAPKDITDSIAEACGAALKSSISVIDSKLEKIPEEIEPLETEGEPRIGVFVCHCGLNIAGLLDCPALADYASKLSDVVYSTNLLFACSESNQRDVQDAIKEHNLTRVVVAACTPKTHEPVFRENLRKVGLNPYLFEMVNIRDQCSWVHTKDPVGAMEKAKDLIRMGVARSKLLKPLESKEMDVGQDVLVIGAGIAGIETAIDLSLRGFKVYLVEKEKELGGRVKALATTYPSGKSGKELIEERIRALEKTDVIVLTETTVKNANGFVGHFNIILETVVGQKIAEKNISAGAIVVAIGSDIYNPSGKYYYGSFKNVLTNMELENFLLENKDIEIGGRKPETIAYIQCVGSRGDEGNSGCSRYCCQAAIKQAITLREKGINVVIFNKDIRVYSKGAERMYRKAREMGVLFLHYDDDNLPRITGKDKAEQITIVSKPLKKEL
ncbi:CoB--CoM heterodisulfide reductase iron-sulfur subunit A family protein, partial [candidate division WOR-3 bacterium]|nr:CoB--CoM heterodisulfide reductase iron-sulfur subunit A family protein [candidate division WOR-3 bacterium]